MNGGSFVVLNGLCVFMFIASFAVGLLPSRLKISNENFNYISLLSMGILIGTSFQLIIPEGIEVLYESEDAATIEKNPRYIGMSLLLGFFIMFLIDNIGGVMSNSQATYTVSSTTLDKIKDYAFSVCKTSTTVGLVFHSLIDGISLGSSFLHHNNAIKLAFFLAIIVHKIPTSFSLGSILIKEGLPEDTMKFHLLIFSLAAPVAALATYLFMLIANLQGTFVIGILFLFSGGAFFFVVVHVMSELTNSGHETTTDIENNLGINTSKRSLTGIEIFCAIVGIFIPVLVSTMNEEF